MVREFERDLALFCNSRLCVRMAGGTDAVHLALVAEGVQPGDTVVTVPLTFIATLEPIFQAGAWSDVVDIDERTYTMDPEKLRAHLETECTPDPQTGRVVGKRTGSPVTAVIPVHFYGQMADMDPIPEVAVRFGLIVIEDACQAQGAGQSHASYLSSLRLQGGMRCHPSQRRRGAARRALSLLMSPALSPKQQPGVVPRCYS